MTRLALAALLMIGALAGGAATMLTVGFITNPVAIGPLIWILFLAVGIAGAAIWGSFQLIKVPAWRLWTIWGAAFAMGLFGWILILGAGL